MTETVAAAHRAEAFRQGYEPHVRWGWHCLTCDVVEYVPTMAEAEASAEAHVVPTAAVVPPDDVETALFEEIADWMTVHTKTKPKYVPARLAENVVKSFERRGWRVVRDA